MQIHNMEAIHQVMKCKLQVEEKKNEGLQVMLEESVTRNAQLLKDKEQQEAAHQLMKCKIQELQAINQEIQCKLQDMERKKIKARTQCLIKPAKEMHKC